MYIASFYAFSSSYCNLSQNICVVYQNYENSFQHDDLVPSKKETSQNL